METWNGIPVCPIQHASGANPRFHQMLSDTNLIKLVQSILHQKKASRVEVSEIDLPLLQTVLREARGPDICHPDFQE